MFSGRGPVTVTWVRVGRRHISARGLREILHRFCSSSLLVRTAVLLVHRLMGLLSPCPRVKSHGEKGLHSPLSLNPQLSFVRPPLGVHHRSGRTNDPTHTHVGPWWTLLRGLNPSRFGLNAAGVGSHRRDWSIRPAVALSVLGTRGGLGETAPRTLLGEGEEDRNDQDRMSREPALGGVQPIPRQSGAVCPVPTSRRVMLVGQGLPVGYMVLQGYLCTEGE